jgi:hypothetical protein
MEIPRENSNIILLFFSLIRTFVPQYECTDRRIMEAAAAR